MSKPLNNIHLLIIDNVEEDRKALVEFLTEQGAVCHTASTRTEAMGKYMTLFADKIIPRAIISDWYINPPTTEEYKFYVSINRAEANTALNLVTRFQQIDPHVEIIIHSNYCNKVPDMLPVRTVWKSEGFKLLSDMLANSSKITHHSTIITESKIFAAQQQEREQHV